MKQRILWQIGAVAVAVGLAQAVMAATITYSTYVATDSADTSWASPADTLHVCAINFGSGNATVYGGVNWSAGTSASWGCGNENLSPYINFSEPGVAWGNNVTTFYPGGPVLLDDGAYLGSAAGLVSMGGFTVGKRYLIQFVVADNRDYGGGGVNEIPGRTIAIQGSGGTIGGQNSAQVQYAYADGRYAVVTADFVADVADFTFVPLVGDGSPGTQINAVQIREVMTFDGIQASDTTTHVISATDWAEYLGGDTTFSGANGGGRLYWRGSAGDGNYMHFDLSGLSGKTNVAPAFVTLQYANATWGGGVDGSFVATADGSWTAGGGQAIPGATPIAGAVNASGSHASGSSVSWGIGSSALQSLVDNPLSDYGLAVIGGSGSQLHFNGPLSPYLTVKTGTLSGSPVAGVITVSGGNAWNAGNYSFDAGDGYSAAASLRIYGAVAGGTSGAGNVTVNGANVLIYQPGGSANYYWPVDSTTINAGGTLTINGHSHIHNLTLAGGDLGGTAVEGTWGGWTIDDPTIVTGGTTSVISARQVNLDNGTITVGPGSSLNVTGTIRSGSLTKAGEGTMVLTQINTYAGGTTVSNGVLELNGAAGGNGLIPGTVTVNAGATLALTGGDGTGFGWNNTISSLAVTGGTVNAAGASHVGFGTAATVVLADGGVITGSWQWNGDSMLSFSSSGDSMNTISGSLVLRSDSGANHTFTVADGAAATDLQIDATFSDQWPEVWWVAASGLTKNGTGTMALTGNNSYGGVTILAGGILNVAALSDYGVAGNLGDRTSGDDSGGDIGILFRGGTLQYTGATLQSTDRAIRISTTGGATLDASGSVPSATMSFTASASPNFFENPGDRTLTLTGSNTGANLFAMAIGEAGGTTALVKSGAGTWVISGANSYTGDTQIDAGTLRLGADNTLDVDNDVVLAGGALDDGGFSNQLGTLEVTSASSIVVGTGSLRFLDSYMVNWTGTLTLVGTLGPQSVRFGNSANALTADQLQKISIDGNPVDIDTNGYLTKASQGTVFFVR